MLHFVSALNCVTQHIAVSLFAVDPCPLCASTVVTKFILDQLLASQALSEGNRYGVSTFALCPRCRQCLLSTAKHCMKILVAPTSYSKMALKTATGQL